MTVPEDLPVAGTVVLLRSVADGFQVLLMRRPERGSFAGAWVFPGGKVEDGDRGQGAGEVDDARRAAIRETFEEVGLAVGDVVTLSRWQPPIDAPTRIRTWFFLSPVFDGELVLSEDEVLEAVWVSPSDALARHAAGEWILFPPTWMTLHELSGFDTAGAAMDSRGAPRLFSTRMHSSPDGLVFEWDALRLETGSLPWRLIEG